MHYLSVVLILLWRCWALLLPVLRWHGSIDPWRQSLKRRSASGGRKRPAKNARFITALVLSACACSSASPFPSDYDRDFQDAALLLPAGTDWRLLKAQCWQESRLNPLAVSPVGAMGLCQFMPGTWERYGEGRDPWLPQYSIWAAAVYMNDLNRFWSSPRPQVDRYLLALASYNAGPGHLLTAQRICGGPLLYAEIITCLPDVTGRHSIETRDYVRKIWGHWYPMMVFD